MRRNFLMKLFIVLTMLYVGTSYSQPQATDSLAAASVSLGLYETVQAYFDSSHAYVNSGYNSIISHTSIVKRDTDYIHHVLTNDGTIAMFSPSAMYIPNDIQIENIQVAYQENALMVTWDIPDTSIADKFHIFYAEAEIEHQTMLDSALYGGMTFEDCWDWEIGVNMYEYFFVIPKRVFPAYTSVIRIGIMPEDEAWSEFPTYGKLFLAPDIVNRTIEAPNSVMLKEITGIPLTIVNAVSQKTSETNHGPLKAIDGKGRNDGDINSRWACTPIPVWIRFDLGSVKQVSELRYSFYGYEEGRLYTYNVQYSRDNVTWFPLVLSKQQTQYSEWTIDNLPVTVDARYIRVQFTASTESTWAGLWEVRILGK